MHVIGTAGHVDHGKSALVAALTGTNPDRWLEEQLRGMTLDLGFAHLRLGEDLEAGIVDVPGHERFLHNMLAGAAGMDVLLVAVDANEGVMPQTLEHLEIVGYLNARRTIVAMTKIDLVPAERRDAARTAIEEALRDTAAHGAPIVGVSSVSGEGMDELRAHLAQALRALPARDPDAPVYLPIDRVFALPGLGTIVTGTLMQGSIATGDVIGLEPSGKRARVRGMQVFGAARARVGAGSRVALNLAGVDRHDVARGEVAVSLEFSARSHFAVRFTPSQHALSLMRRRVPVRAYLGSAEILGTLILDEVPDGVVEVRAQLHLREPAVAFPGVRFVVRRPSPKTLLGGGTVVGLETGAPVETDASGESLSPAQTAVLAVLRERGLDALDAGAIALAANLRADVVRDALAGLAERDDALALRRPPAYVDGGASRELLARTIDRLEEMHREEPWAMGATSIALARALGVAEPLLVRILTEFAEQGRLAARGGYYAALGHQPALTSQQHALFEGLVPAVPGQALLPAIYGDVLAAVRRPDVAGAPKAFDTLLARGVLIRVGDDLYRGTQVATILARVDEFFHRNERMTAAEFRDLIGTSRKYAVPLLEWLDARGVTIRSGDHRMLRKKSP